MRTIKNYLSLMLIAVLVMGSLKTMADSWTPKNLQTRGRNSPANFSIGTKGYWGVTSVADWWEYTPAIDTWVQKASFPGGSRTGIASISIGNLGYVGFGYVSNIGTN